MHLSSPLLPEVARSDRRRLSAFGLLVGSALLVSPVSLVGCTKLGQYYPARTRGLAVATHDAAEASHRELERLQQRRLVMEQEIVSLRARVTAAESKAEVCESEARAMSRGGAYSRVR